MTPDELSTCSRAGFEQFKFTNRRKVPVLMLTAKTIKEGASFVTKQEIASIETYAADVLEALEKKNPWTVWAPPSIPSSWVRHG